MSSGYKVLISICWFLLFQNGESYGQKDSLILSNSDIIVGQIQEMNRNVLTVSTPYSSSDFKISWKQVKEIYSERLFAVTFSDRTLMTTATITTISPGVLNVENAFLSREVTVGTIVYLRPVFESFRSKLSASADIGYSITKANNLHQYNGSLKLGYKSDQWAVNGTYRQVTSSQENVEPVRRVEASMEGDYSLENGIFFRAGINFLSNSEQRLLLRTLGNVGGGYYFVRRNTWFWNGHVALAINNENYEEIPETEGSSDRNSLESIVGTTLNLYNIGDLGLTTNLNWYPSFTEAGRHRIDYKMDVSYSLPWNFYVKVGLTLNYDSDPVPGASESDYVVLTGFGWEL